MLFAEKNFDNQIEHHPPALEEICRRAFKIHREHGSVSNGYTLDDWLKAEHELEDEATPVRRKDPVH